MSTLGANCEGKYDLPDGIQMTKVWIKSTLIQIASKINLRVGDQMVA